MGYMRRWPWVAQQGWSDVLFMHWPVPYDLLKPYVPDPFILETYNGDAWVSVVLFRAKRSRLRSMPFKMSYPSFFQMNLRTYIKFDNEPSIYFLSVDVNRLLPMIAAKKLLQLPYHIAEMRMENIQDQRLFTSKRTNHILSEPQISIMYQPLINKVFNQKDTLPYWLTERYCFWKIYGNKVVKGPLSHMPWTLHHAELELTAINMMPSILNQYLHFNPLVHYAKYMHAHLHPFEQIGIYEEIP